MPKFLPSSVQRKPAARKARILTKKSTPRTPSTRCIEGWWKRDITKVRSVHALKGVERFYILGLIQGVSKYRLITEITKKHSEQYLQIGGKVKKYIIDHKCSKAQAIDYKNSLLEN
jgi:hypothetical protein